MKLVNGHPRLLSVLAVAGLFDVRLGHCLLHDHENLSHNAKTVQPVAQPRLGNARSTVNGSHTEVIAGFDTNAAPRSDKPPPLFWMCTQDGEPHLVPHPVNKSLAALNMQSWIWQSFQEIDHHLTGVPIGIGSTIEPEANVLLSRSVLRRSAVYSRLVPLKVSLTPQNLRRASSATVRSDASDRTDNYRETLFARGAAMQSESQPAPETNPDGNTDNPHGDDELYRPRTRPNSPVHQNSGTVLQGQDMPSPPENPIHPDAGPKDPRLPSRPGSVGSPNMKPVNGPEEPPPGYHPIRHPDLFEPKVKVAPQYRVLVPGQQVIVTFENANGAKVSRWLTVTNEHAVEIDIKDVRFKSISFETEAELHDFGNKVADMASLTKTMKVGKITLLPNVGRFLESFGALGRATKEMMSKMLKNAANFAKTSTRMVWEAYGFLMSLIPQWVSDFISIVNWGQMAWSLLQFLSAVVPYKYGKCSVADQVCKADLDGKIHRCPVPSNDPARKKCLHDGDICAYRHMVPAKVVCSWETYQMWLQGTGMNPLTAAVKVQWARLHGYLMEQEQKKIEMYRIELKECNALVQSQEMGLKHAVENNASSWRIHGLRTQLQGIEKDCQKEFHRIARHERWREWHKGRTDPSKSTRNARRARKQWRIATTLTKKLQGKRKEAHDRKLQFFRAVKNGVSKPKLRILKQRFQAVYEDIPKLQAKLIQAVHRAQKFSLKADPVGLLALNRVNEADAFDGFGPRNSTLLNSNSTTFSEQVVGNETYMHIDLPSGQSLENSTNLLLVRPPRLTNESQDVTEIQLSGTASNDSISSLPTKHDDEDHVQQPGDPDPASPTTDDGDGDNDGPSDTDKNTTTPYLDGDAKEGSTSLKDDDESQERQLEKRQLPTNSSGGLIWSPELMDEMDMFTSSMGKVNLANNSDFSFLDPATMLANMTNPYMSIGPDEALLTELPWARIIAAGIAFVVTIVLLFNGFVWACKKLWHRLRRPRYHVIPTLATGGEDNDHVTISGSDLELYENVIV